MEKLTLFRVLYVKVRLNNFKKYVICTIIIK